MSGSDLRGTRNADSDGRPKRSQTSECYDSNISPTYRGRPVGLRMPNSMR